jgi:hypothetical protein
MDVILDIFNKVCVLVTAASALTLVRGFRRSERSLLSVRDRGTALLVFLILGLVEEAAVGQTGWPHRRGLRGWSAGRPWCRGRRRCVYDLDSRYLPRTAAGDLWGCDV